MLAFSLPRAGAACVVVEARDRVGGRLHTIDLAGFPVDMGGSWIHHQIGNPLRAFADRLVSVAVRVTPCRRWRPLTSPRVGACRRVRFARS